MQLMPATWQAMRVSLGLGDNPDDPRDNMLAGTFYLRLMYDRFGYPGLFAAYNAGPARYAVWLAGEAGLPAETEAYLRRVTVDGQARAEASEAPADTLFLVRREAPAAKIQDLSPSQAPAMFVLRREVP